MNTQDVTNSIRNYMIDNSGFETTRSYLSISHISGCPRRAVDEYKNGFTVNENTYRMCFAGYDQEKSIRGILEKTGILVIHGLEVIAPFDNRLRGHVDGISKDGDLIEIKSLSVKKWEKLLLANKAFYEHYCQCQLYMLYGKFNQTFIVYRNRETYEHKVISFDFSPAKAHELELKSRIILDAINTGNLPKCECGHCK